MKSVLITVGSQVSFDSLIEHTDKLIGKEADKIRGVAQIGNGKYIPSNMIWHRFIPDLGKRMREFDLIITHSGVGTILEALSYNKPILVVPNPNTNQLENIDIIRKLSPTYVFSSVVKDLDKAPLLQYCDSKPPKFTCPNIDLKELMSDIEPKKKIMFHLGTGGHTRQMKRIYELFHEKRYDEFVPSWAWSESEYEHEHKPVLPGNVYNLQSARKSRDQAPSAVYQTSKAFIQAYNALRKEKPDFVISVGPGSAVPLSVACKLTGVKFIFIEDQSRVYGLSGTGKLISKLNTYYKFYVQWEELEKASGFKYIGLIQ